MGFRQRVVKQENYDQDGSSDENTLLESADIPIDGASKVWKRVQEESKYEYRLLEYHALPDYLKDNEYILSHYRADLTFSQALNSLFRMHNETVNIWTYVLFGCVICFSIVSLLPFSQLSGFLYKHEHFSYEGLIV